LSEAKSGIGVSIFRSFPGFAALNPGYKRERPMRILLFTLGILVAVTALGTDAQAQNYPWCAIYGGGSAGGGRNCGFTTFEQCQATISGIGGTCQQNTTYQPPGAAARKNWQQKW
jgi:Protein of unknown function (DUF3551)